MPQVYNPSQISKIVDNGKCIGCGFCKASCSTPEKVSLEYNRKTDSYTPRFAEGAGSNMICPGEDMNLPQIATDKFGHLPEDPILGTYQSLHVTYSNDPSIRDNAASGGMVPSILRFLFEQNMIDVAYCADPGDTLYDAKAVLIHSPDELGRIHGAIYHPVNFGVNLDSLVRSEKRFAFVGLPCQVAGLEMLKKQIPGLAKRHVLSVGLFCGGINTFGGIGYYLRAFNVALEKVKQLYYRKGAWPGQIQLLFKSNQPSRFIPRIRGNSRWKILRYVIAFQGYWMLPRCRICPDQISDFADIAVGDPHGAQYRKRGGGFSAVIVRTAKGQAIFDSLSKRKMISTEPISARQLEETQGYTLDNRRHVVAYLKVNAALGGSNPDIKTYPQLAESASLRHFVYASVDLIKTKLPKNKFIEVFYLPWQVFEYLFLTFAPNLIIQRIMKLARNE